MHLMEIHLDHRCKYKRIGDAKGTNLIKVCERCGEKPIHGGPARYCYKPTPCAVSFNLEHLTPHLISFGGAGNPDGEGGFNPWEGKPRRARGWLLSECTVSKTRGCDTTLMSHE